MPDRIHNVLAGLFSGGYRQVRSPLSPDRAVRSQKGFGFGVPWPWEEVPLSAIQGASARPDVAVGAPRTDGRTALFMVTERGPWNGLAELETQRMLQAFASQHAARPRGIRKVTLAGVPAQILQAWSHEAEFQLVLTSLGPNLLEGFFRAPQSGYLHHLDVILATWAWIG